MRFIHRFLAISVAPSLFFGLLSPPGTCAQSSAPAASFEVASIKPNRSGNQLFRLMFTPDGFSASGVALKGLIGFAYHMKDFQTSGGPGWVDSESYDIEAKMDESTVTALKRLPPDKADGQRFLMLQSLLEERFNLKVSHSTKELPIYALVVAKNGPKLRKSADSPSGSRGPGGKSFMGLQVGRLTATGVSMRALADQIAHEVGRQVVNKTGLEGRYDFSLHWASEGQGLSAGSADGEGPPLNASSPSIFTALQEQLGLKLESQKGPVETLIIESIERPAQD